MKVKKFLAGLSAFTMMFSATIGYFPELHKGTHSLTAAAEEDVPQILVDEGTETESSEVPEETSAPEAQETTEAVSKITVNSVMPVMVKDSEQTENGWQYTVYDNTVTITGYSGNATKLTIPSEIEGKPVTEIDSYAFADNTTITSVNLGSIQKIGYSVFEGCTSLKSLTIPKTLTEAKYDGYYGNAPLTGSSITSVTFEEGIENIPAYICYGVSSLTSVTLPEKSDTIDGYSIGDSAFSRTSLSAVELPSSLTRIGKYAFSECSLLKKISIPDNVTEIGTGVFNACTSLTNVSIGNSVETIANDSFRGCTQLTEVTFGTNVVNIDSYAFEGCKRLPKVDLSESVKSIGDCVFMNCTSLESVTLGSIHSIGYNVFENCTSLKSLTIPKTLTEAKYDSYYGNAPLTGSSITSVTFEEGIENIPAYICYRASSLTSVTLPEKSDTIDGYSIGDGAFSKTSLSAVELPSSLTRIGQHAFSECSLLKKISIQDKVTEIGVGAFNACTSLTNISIGNSVETIANDSFRGCTQLTEVTFGTNVVSIGGYAFEGCKRLPKVALSKSIESIGDCVFMNCTSLESVTLGSIHSIGYNVFENCTSLKSLTIPKTLTEAKYDSYYGNAPLTGSSITSVTFEEGIENIPAYICYRASSLTSVTLPEKSDTIDGYSIGDGAFSKTSLSAVELPSSLTRIGQHAFSECKLKKIIIPDKVTEIGTGAFNACTSLANVNIGNSVETIANDSFRGCTQLTEVTFGTNVVSIGGYAFEGCKRLPKVALSKSIESIGDCVFMNCTSLESVTLGSIHSIGYNVFENCTSLKSLTIPKTLTEAKYDSYYGNAPLTGSSIDSLTFASGMKVVPAYIASWCTSLKKVNLSDTVTEIGDYAFYGCSRLEEIHSDLTAIAFHAHSFESCDKFSDSRFSVFDTQNTYLASNSGQLGVNDVVNYILKYKLTPSMAKNAQNLELHLNIPEGMTLLMDTIQSSNLTLDPEDFTDGVISVDATTGEIRFSVRLTEIGEYQVGANLEFYDGSSYWNQPIGSQTVECPDLTIAVPESVNEFTAEVYGLAAKGEEVTIYVNDTVAGTLTASVHTGKYKGSVVLPSGNNGDSYTIYAQCGSITTDAVYTTYSSEEPVVKNAVMKYNQHSSAAETLDVTDVLTQGTSPVISYNPSYPMSFEITATNNEKIGRMFITSTKGSEMKYMEAFYDEKTGLWVASGYFDDNNHQYVPGSLNISIIEKETIVLDENTDTEQYDKLESLPQEYLDNSSIDVLQQTDDAVVAQINLSDGENTDDCKVYFADHEDGVYIDGNYQTAEKIAENPEKYGFEQSIVKYVEDGQVYSYYTKTINHKDVEATMLMNFGNALEFANDFWTGKTILRICESDPDNIAVDLLNDYSTATFGEIAEEIFGEEFGKGYGFIGNVLSLGSDFAKYAEELQMADENVFFEGAATALFYAKLANTIAFDSPFVNLLPFPISAILSIGLSHTIDFVEKYLIELMEDDMEFSLSGFIRFIIDPSGIVYEAVIGNPVEGVTVTAYYLDPETGETIKWDAEDYDQMNPLLTNAEGKYVWDVPEGQWKVVCEKEGYTTVETEWMDIPPVRTDVNIMMISQEAPKLETVEKNGNEITVKFSKFVDISTVNEKTLTVDGYEGSYTITPVVLNENDSYADTFLVTGDFSDSITNVSVSDDIISYADVAAEKGNMKITVVSTIGDVNKDNKINNKDIVLLQRYIAGGWDVELNEASADVNKDGTINNKDVVLLQRYIAGGWNVEIA